jgi:Carboxypeptidase regulatory-like domain
MSFGGTWRRWRSLLACAGVVTLYLALPSGAAAQVIAGIVRDASGGVLPGVTVEATSPALIEKVRSTVTDGTGQYRLENLAPGVYSVSYALPGFTTIVRESVQLQSGVVVTINTDLRVGGLQETITVTGETPVVDVQSSTRMQRVIDDEVVAALPASRGYGNLLQTVAGIQATGAANSGANPVMNFFTSRGGRSNEGTVQIDGMNVGSAFNGGGVSSYGYDTANSQEVQITVAGGLGETDRGGPQFNLVPKAGGNTFSGTVFGSTAGKWSQGDNLDDGLRAFGITEVPQIIKNWDTSFALGGPIMRDKVWFFGVLRTFGNHNDVAGVYANLNAANPAAWNYVKDDAVKERLAEDKKIAGVRLTSQITARNKVSAFWDYQKACQGGAFQKDGDQCRGRGDDWVAVGAFGSWSPEASHVWDDRERIQQYSWTSPVTNKLLLEAGYSQFLSNWGGQTPAGALDYAPFIPVTEQSTLAGTPLNNFVYHGFAGLGNNYQSHNVWRASMAYVTGTHSLKVGYQAAYEVTDSFGNFPTHGLAYRFNNGQPNQLTQRITPWQQGNRTRYDGFYAQDQWTRGRVTVQGALRYEHAWSFFPEGKSGLLEDSVFGGAAYTLPAADGVKGYHDIAPRMGVAYDVFGNGKTAIKANLSKYWQSANNEGNYTTANRAATFAQTTTRSWTDGNNNKVPDCDLQNRALQDNRASGGDLCGAWDNQNFGSIVSATTLNPDVLEGWGVRPYDWQFGVSLQQELLPRVSAEVGYSRRWWGNFFYTDNLDVGPEHYDTLTFTAPSHPDLPTSGQQVSYKLIKDSGFGRVRNYYTFASDYGDVTSYWHGVDLTVNARMSNGLSLQGGFSTGGGIRDTCEITAKLPEILGNQQVSSCEVNEVWLWNWRGLANYIVPKIDVQVSAILRSQANTSPGGQVGSNGASLSANYNITNAQVIAALGRPLAGNAQNTSVDLTRPGELYADRINSVDMRFAKILRFGRTRSTVGIDLYNMLNANTGTAFQQTFDPLNNGATWLRPTQILNPRFVRFNVTVDF